MRINRPHLFQSISFYIEGGIGDWEKVIGPCLGKPNEYVLSTYCVPHVKVGVQVIQFWTILDFS